MNSRTTANRIYGFVFRKTSSVLFPKLVDGRNLFELSCDRPCVQDSWSSGLSAQAVHGRLFNEESIRVFELKAGETGTVVSFELGKILPICTEKEDIALIRFGFDFDFNPVCMFWSSTSQHLLSEMCKGNAGVYKDNWISKTLPLFSKLTPSQSWKENGIYALIGNRLTGLHADLSEINVSISISNDWKDAQTRAWIVDISAIELWGNHVPRVPEAPEAPQAPTPVHLDDHRRSVPPPNVGKHNHPIESTFVQELFNPNVRHLQQQAYRRKYQWYLHLQINEGSRDEIELKTNLVKSWRTIAVKRDHLYNEIGWQETQIRYRTNETSDKSKDSEQVNEQKLDDLWDEFIRLQSELDTVEFQMRSAGIQGPPIVVAAAAASSAHATEMGEAEGEGEDQGDDGSYGFDFGNDQDYYYYARSPGSSPSRYHPNATFLPYNGVTTPPRYDYRPSS